MFRNVYHEHSDDTIASYLLLISHNMMIDATIYSGISSLCSYLLMNLMTYCDAIINSQMIWLIKVF